MMSGDAALLPCPLCSYTGAFLSAESLRDKLIQVSTNILYCPICQEEILGLDKLTIHLFSHVKILPKNSSDEKHKDSEKKFTPKLDNHSAVQQKRPKAAVAKNKPSCLAATAPVKFVKIFPKLPVISLNAVPVLDISRSTTNECQQSSEIIIKTETSILSTNTTCNICGLQFVDANILRMHRALIHNIDESSTQSFTRYNCHLCPKNFKMRGSLMVHLRVAHYGFLSGNNDPAINLSNKDIDDKNTDKLLIDKSQNVERNENKQWQCDVCRKCFTTKYFLKKHKRLHTGETPYACTQCSKTFTFQQSYHKHLLYHNDEKPHTCSFCGRSFKELSTLHNHQRIHTGEKPFSCETCGKCFRQRVSYLVHRRIHTGVMPYKCTACEKSFRYKVSQRTHKCQAQPPGTVVRQAGDLIEKLKKKHTDNDQVSTINDKGNSPNDSKYLEVSEANAELVRSGAKLSLEDMESENFTLLADSFNEELVDQIYDSTPGTSLNNSSPYEQFDAKQSVKIDSNIDALIDAIPILDKSVPSPSEILKNLCLSKEEDFKELFHNGLNEKDFGIHKDFNDFL